MNLATESCSNLCNLTPFIKLMEIPTIETFSKYSRIVSTRRDE